MHRFRYKTADFEIEVETADKAFLDACIKKYVDPIDQEESAQDSSPKKKKSPAKRQSPKTNQPDAEEAIDVADLVNQIQELKEHDILEQNIINKHNQLAKVMLCFYYAAKLIKQEYLTTGQVEKITDQFGMKIKVANVSTTIKKNSKYFSTSQTRKQGAILKYKLNQKGKLYFGELQKPSK